MSAVVQKTFIESAREETRPLHDELEEVLGLERIVGSKISYVETLGKFYGVWKPLEGLVSRSPLRDESDLNPESRMRSDRIVADLLALGADAKIPLSPVPWSGLSPAEAVGILYVLEGSTLGGQVISRRLRNDLGVGSENGGSFFAGHGERNGKMWRSFLDWVSREITEEKEIDEAVSSAVKTFGLLVGWFQRPATE